MNIKKNAVTEDVAKVGQEILRKTMKEEMN